MFNRLHAVISTISTGPICFLSLCSDVVHLIYRPHTFACLHAVMYMSTDPICLPVFIQWCHSSYQQAPFFLPVYAVMLFIVSTGSICLPVFMQWCRSSYQQAPYALSVFMQWCCSPYEQALYVYLSLCSDVIHHINRPHMFTCLCSDVIHHINRPHMFTCLFSDFIIILTGPICLPVYSVMSSSYQQAPYVYLSIQWCHNHINRPHMFICLCSDVIHHISKPHMFTCLYAVMSIVPTGPYAYLSSCGDVITISKRPIRLPILLMVIFHWMC